MAKTKAEAEGGGCSTCLAVPCQGSPWTQLSTHPALPGLPALGAPLLSKCNSPSGVPLRTPSVDTLNPFQGFVHSPGCVWRAQAELWINVQPCENHLPAVTAAAGGLFSTVCETPSSVTKCCQFLMAIVPQALAAEWGRWCRVTQGDSEMPQRIHTLKTPWAFVAKWGECHRHIRAGNPSAHWRKLPLPGLEYIYRNKNTIERFIWDKPNHLSTWPRDRERDTQLPKLAKALEHQAFPAALRMWWKLSTDRWWWGEESWQMWGVSRQVMKP